jgi:hypothetical protein
MSVVFLIAAILFCTAVVFLAALGGFMMLRGCCPQCEDIE